jgi:mutator protein MutT
MQDVVLVILYQNDRFLLAQRAIDDGFGGKWTFPGGKINHNETTIDAVYRELYEEVGVKGQRFRLLCNTQTPQYHIHIFYCDQWTCELRPSDPEIIGMGWFTLSEIYMIEKSLAPVVSDNLGYISYLTQHYKQNPREWIEQWTECSRGV